MAKRLAWRFLGVGNARASELGSAAAVFEIDEQPALLIDCGPRTLDDYAHYYGTELPPALFITHLHLDHIGGVEQLFYRAYFASQTPIKFFVPAALVPALTEKLAASPYVLSEGGANFWDAFHLNPVADQFWWRDLLFDVFPVRHSGYRGAYGLGLCGAFFYSGDTRPVPELLSRFANTSEVIFHDCALEGSPAHTGVDDLRREYDTANLRRMVIYHFESAAAAQAIEAAGLQVARRGDCIKLNVAASRSHTEDDGISSA